MNSATILQKLCNCCNVPRDDGMRCSDCVECLTPHRALTASQPAASHSSGRR
jgi:hypothetical protein